MFIRGVMPASGCCWCKSPKAVCAKEPLEFKKVYNDMSIQQHQISETLSTHMYAHAHFSKQNALGNIIKRSRGESMYSSSIKWCFVYLFSIEHIWRGKWDSPTQTHAWALVQDAGGRNCERESTTNCPSSLQSC